MKKKLSAAALTAEINRQKKRLKKMSFRLKAKVFLTVILPGCIALLALQTVKTFLRIRLRETASGISPDEAAGEAYEPVPVELEMSPPDFVTPKPVKTEVVWRSSR